MDPVTNLVDRTAIVRWPARALQQLDSKVGYIANCQEPRVVDGVSVDGGVLHWTGRPVEMQRTPALDAEQADICLQPVHDTGDSHPEVADLRDLRQPRDTLRSFIFTRQIP